LVGAAGSLASVTATWTQPTVWPPSSGWAYATVCVDLQDGHSVEQIGTDGYSLNGPPARYDAWYQLYPAPSVPIVSAIKQFPSLRPSSIK
jgi:hypothetical protein